MIRFDQVYKRYDGEAVVVDVSLEIKEGEFFVLIGPSGSGKTTTLKMINKLVELSEGDITIEGKNIDDYKIQDLRWNIGYVLQQIALFPNMTVEENIVVVPEMLKWSKEQQQERVTELLSTVHLKPEKYRNRKISELSGGEQQRIGVIRALAADPDIILMDEPFSALDPISRSSLQNDVMDLQKELKKTIVFVTHDMQEAINLGDRIGLMNQGKIEQVGTAEEILKNPANEFVEKFVQTGLPHYKEEQTVQTFIDEGYTTQQVHEDHQSAETVDVNASIQDLAIILTKSPSVKINEKQASQMLYITREHLIEFYAKELEVNPGGLSE